MSAQGRWRVGAAGVVLLAAIASAPPTPAAQPIVLSDGRTITPAGTLTSAGDFPATIVQAGPYSYVSDAGEGANLLLAFRSDVPAGATAPLAFSTSAAPYSQSGSLSLTPDGATLLVGGGTARAVHVYNVNAGVPVPVRSFTLPVDYVGSVAAGSDGQTVFVSTPFDGSVHNDKGHTLVRATLSGGDVRSLNVGHNDLGLSVADVPGVGEVVAVANRGDGTVSIVDGRAMRVLRTIPVGRQPAAMAFSADHTRLFVVNSLDDNLIVFSTSTWLPVDTVALGAGGGLGAAPSALTLGPDGNTAYVVLSADNAVAVLERRVAGWTVTGRVPTAWYPTGVAVDAANRRLLVTSGKGTGQQFGVPPGLPVSATTQPLAPGPTAMGLSGTLQDIPLPSAAELSTYTAEVAANNRVSPGSGGATLTQAALCPPSANLAPIKHVVYIIRENKTYDEEFGDLPGGDPAGLLYGRPITPNTHALAEKYALLTNFYDQEELSDTGHQAAMGASVNDWTMRFSQQAYGTDFAPRQGSELGNDSSILWDPANYLFDLALAHGVSFRDYGEFYRRDQAPSNGPVSPELGQHIIKDFPGFGFDPGTPDTRRVAFWRKAFAADVSAGTFPQLEVLYLPEDHTTDGAPDAQGLQQVADSDLATGQVIDTLSHSPYWGSTAVFLTEDDPQSGVDHVDQHRSLGLVVSPYVAQVQSAAHYDQVGMLRTIEEILGLPPLTEFDATAHPMDDLFKPTPRGDNYSAATPAVAATTPALAAQVRALSRQRLGPNPDLAHVRPRDQLDILWLEARGMPYSPPRFAARASESVPPASSACASAPTPSPVRDALPNTAPNPVPATVTALLAVVA
ncbi:MAG: bifunctional YncE family protein/alkaline phosphatase family protein, partial [Candidatus Dormibacteraeota bacterium]|nr:bifunctional YncE family protein/alkaline phosphatase family protein [Candidatus Dormibacteraeota bacterium]